MGLRNGDSYLTGNIWERMFCTLYFSSRMSGERLLAPFESQGKGHVSTADQVPCAGDWCCSELSDELLLCREAHFSWQFNLYGFHKISLPVPWLPRRISSFEGLLTRRPWDLSPSHGSYGRSARCRLRWPLQLLSEMHRTNGNSIAELPKCQEIFF